MEVTIEQIRQILHLAQPSHPDNRIINQILTDSRNLFCPAQTLFIALVTPRQDGHYFIAELYQKGVRAFLINQLPEGDFPDAAFLKVSDTLLALQQLAIAWRKQFSIPVIGITGSNGKTIVKEWLFQLLANDYRIIRSPKSYNSQIGVPLSVFQINKTHELGIFEAGISQPDEMQRLEKIIRPSLCIFTNIGEAHAEGFNNIRQKIREKLQLFSNSELLIYRQDHTLIHEEVQSFIRIHPGLQLFSWTSEPDLENNTADFVITDIQKKTDKNDQTTSEIHGIFAGKPQSIEVPFADAGSIENTIHCWCLMLHLKTKAAVIRKRMKALQAVAMRLEMKPGIQDCILINDSYNSDIASIKVALDFLSHQQQHQKRTLILSDVVQSGEPEQTLYRHIASLLEGKDIQRFIGIGKSLYRQKKAFQHLTDSAFYPTTERFIQALNKKKSSGLNLPFHQETILLKGARFFEFEKISKQLEQKKHQTELVIDLNAVTHNLKTYQSLLKPGVKTMVMVKAFSYGSGSAEIAGLLQFHRIDYLAVANIDEGIELRKNGITIPIVVLNPDPFYFEELIQWQLEPELYSPTILKAFHKKITQLGATNNTVHIKLDTGMHRLGFSSEQISELLQFLKTQKGLKVASVFSHLAASEDPRMDDFTKKQGALFEKMSKKITNILPYPVLRHLANSSGISRHPGLQYDMVRLGIGLYGIDPAMKNKLQLVHRLKTTISQIKEVPAGETIGYGRSGKAKTNKRIAVVALGYADGYLRSLGMGNAKMFLHGKWAQTIGTICMDMLMLDITNIPEAGEGDTVTVFGDKPKIETLAAWGNTIPYEILTGLSQRIVRVYVQE